MTLGSYMIIATLKWPGGSGHANSRRYIGIIVYSCVWTIPDWRVRWPQWIMGYSPRLPMPHLARLTSPKSVIICPLGPSCSFLTPWNRKKHSNFSYGTTGNVSSSRWEELPVPWDGSLQAFLACFRLSQKASWQFPKWRCWRKHLVETKNEKPTRTIQKHSKAKVYQMDWHGTMAYLT